MIKKTKAIFTFSIYTVISIVAYFVFGASTLAATLSIVSGIIWIVALVLTLLSKGKNI